MGVETGAADARASRVDDDPAGHPDAAEAEPTGDDAPAPGPTAAHAPAHAADDPDRGTPLDRWWGRVLSTPRRRTLWYWGGPILVTLLAAVLRFWNLGHPQAIVFDETYYVKDAWT
ncbi:MAG TPA: hypothetical protein VFR16_08300, partial [Agromyces mariniharenae]|nr:hypothetical protein [Agromyces mariniharenae]